MTRLPANFPSIHLDLAARLQMEWFYSTFVGEYSAHYRFGHMVMLAYSAIPAYITPDMLYKLRQNFNEYTWLGKKEIIHPLAVSDVLLAPFCKQISYELYRMDHNVRLSLLEWLRNGMVPVEDAEHTLRAIALFVEKYVETDHDTAAREGPVYVNEQLMEAISYRDPEEVARFYAEKLKAATSEREKLLLINKILNQKEKENVLGPSLSDQVFNRHFGGDDFEIWKHLIQDNREALTDLLLKSDSIGNESNGGRISITTVQQESSVRLKIPGNRQDVIEGIDSRVNARNFAFILAGSEEDIENCSLFAATLHTVCDDQKWLIAHHPGMISQDILGQVRNELSSVSAHDNILLYVSASEVSRPVSNRQIGELFSGIPHESLTVILDGALRASPYWLDTGRPGHVLIAKSAEPAGSGFSNTGGEYPGHAESFTKALCDELVRTGGMISYRDLYLAIVSGRQNGELSTFLALETNRHSYHFNFGFREKKRSEIRRLLLLKGYLDENRSQWDKSAERAYHRFLGDTGLLPDMAEAKKKLEEMAQRDLQDKKPVLLFIFSDAVGNRRPLWALQEEIHAVKKMVSGKMSDYCEVMVFQNRKLAEIDRYVKKPENRNRIGLVYFAGYDNNGNPALEDGDIDAARWCEWMYFQEQIEVVVMNSCFSANLACILVNIGVSQAFGHPDVVLDDNVGEIGIKLLRAVVENDIERILN